MNDNNTSESVRPEASARLSWLRIWGPTVAWMLVILIGTSIPSDGHGPEKGTDKIGHFLVYAVLVVLVHRSWHLSRSALRPKFGLVGPLLIAGGWALFDELHQLAIPTRDFDVRDLAANAVGITVGLVLIICWRHSRREQLSN